MQHSWSLALTFSLMLLACDEVVEERPSAVAQAEASVAPEDRWVIARTASGGARVVWLDADACLASVELDAEGDAVGGAPRRDCGAGLHALDAAVSDPARSQTLLLGRRGSQAAIIALADDPQAAPAPVAAQLETAAPLRGVVRGETLYLATLTPSRGVLERGTPRAAAVPIALPPRARAEAEDAWPVDALARGFEVEAPGASEVDIAHDGESVALLTRAGARVTTWVFPSWSPVGVTTVAVPGRAQRASVVADGDGLWWVVARGPKTSAQRWPPGIRHVDRVAAEVAVAPRPEGGLWVAWRDLQGAVFVRAEGAARRDAAASVNDAERVEALSETTGKLAVVSLPGAALLCGARGSSAPDCVHVDARHGQGASAENSTTVAPSATP